MLHHTFILHFLDGDADEDADEDGDADEDADADENLGDADEDGDTDDDLGDGHGWSIYGTLQSYLMVQQTRDGTINAFVTLCLTTTTTTLLYNNNNNLQPWPLVRCFE